MSSGRAEQLILIVDDDVVTAQTLAAILQRAGFETLCAHDLATAEEIVRSQSISLMLLDVYLPDGNGLDLCGRLLADPKLEGLPIIVISADTDVQTKVRGFSLGAVDYITKPLAGAEVMARVRTHLRLRAAYDALSDLQAERIRLLSASQQSLMPLPEDQPDAGFRVCMRQIHQAGGDFYDVVSAGRGITDYVVADAAGHDIAIALWTAAFKTLLADYATATLEPYDICRMINRSLRRVLPEGAYFTAIYGRLNRTTNKLCLVNAGHPSALLLRPEAKESRELTQEGDIIGQFPDAVFGHLEISVQPGDRIFLYSDGLIEQEGSRCAGSQRLEDACRASADMPLDQAIASVVDALCGEREVEDDIVLLGVEV